MLHCSEEPSAAIAGSIDPDWGKIGLISHNSKSKNKNNMESSQEEEEEEEEGVAAAGRLSQTNI